MNRQVADNRDAACSRASEVSDQGGPADHDLVEKLANALLYEGYMLYPYRASAVKNQQRFNFGGLYPPAYVRQQAGADAARMQTECLVVADGRTTLSIRVRFLHLARRQIARRVDCQAGAEPHFEPVDSLEVSGRRYYAWQEAVERDVPLSVIDLARLGDRPIPHAFAFPAGRTVEPLPDERGETVAVITRSQAEIRGQIEIAVEQLADGPLRVRIAIENQTPLDESVPMGREEALLRTLTSTHTILTVAGGEFVSLLDPPEKFRDAAAGCQNIGAWPVLVGAEGQRDTLLASPIILYDYPQIAPESAGDLFDGTEIDEILTLRVMLLTDEEKREMSAVDERARRILERTETLPAEQLWKMHGAVRGLRASKEASP